MGKVQSMEAIMEVVQCMYAVEGVCRNERTPGGLAVMRRTWGGRSALQ